MLVRTVWHSILYNTQQGKQHTCNDATTPDIPWGGYPRNKNEFNQLLFIDPYSTKNNNKIISDKMTCSLDI